MNRNWLPRLILLLALVFAQALYAGHAVQHSGGGNLSDCSVCLQASSGADALLAVNIEIIANPITATGISQTVQTCFSSKTSYNQHSRAPPASRHK
ncbi:MAG: hypothetical protein IMF09_10405 [Proteobacteria bacterium]|nr:hypothetical protein [Pseudomonadota bacterium]